MKPIEPQQIDQLLEILQKKPAQRIVHFADETHILTPELHKFCLTQENDYYLYCTSPIFYEESLVTHKDKPYLHVKNFNLRRPRYLIQAIEYDYLLSTLSFETENKEAFLKKCYPIIRTGGNIILIIPSTGYTQWDEWREILVEQYYVSINIIDDIFDDYDVVVAKRMHGWGN